MPPSDRTKPISSERMQESLALLEMLGLGNRQIEAGQVQPAAEVMARIRECKQAG